MKLENSIIYLKDLLKNDIRIDDIDNLSLTTKKHIETVLQVLENSILREKIEDKILELQEAIIIENASMYGRGNEKYIKELELKISILRELMEE